MKLFPYNILFLIIIFFAISCVREYPKGEEADPTNIETTIRLFTQPEFTHSSFTARGENTCMYFIVEIYKDKIKGSPIIRREIGAHKQADGSSTLELKEKLHAGHYKVIAWAVCTENIDGTGCLFSLTDLSSIEYQNDYTGCTDKKECYSTQFDMDLSSNEWFATTEFSEEMLCPMGSVEIITTDLQEFIKQVGIPAQSLDEYHLKWNYGLYFPIGYNAFTALPNKAETQVSFKSTIIPRSETEASLGFDYIFVNGQESQVSVTLVLYDKNNKIKNIYSDIKIQLERGKTTVIRGDFLTNRKDSGIEIDPDFDDNIDIVLPD